MNKTVVAKELVAVAKELVGARKRRADYGDTVMYVNAFNSIFKTPDGVLDYDNRMIEIVQDAVLEEYRRTTQAVLARVKRDPRCRPLLQAGITFRG